MPTETLGAWEDRRGLDKLAADIAALPETAEPHTIEPLETQDGPVVLLERSNGGWRTELRLCADGRLAVTATQGERLTRACFIPGDKALDAFHHPWCYLEV